MVTGKLERGVIKKGDDGIILGHGKTMKTVITGNDCLPNHARLQHSTAGVILYSIIPRNDYGQYYAAVIHNVQDQL